MIVVPVPCRFWLLLKFDTRMSPGCSTPSEAMVRGVKTTPYGLTSPLLGTVETVGICSGKKGCADCAGDPGVNCALAEEPAITIAVAASMPHRAAVSVSFEAAVKMFWIVVFMAFLLKM